MDDTVIRVEGLSKSYRLGERQRYLSLRESLAGWAAAPLRRLRARGQAGRDIYWALRDVSFDVKRGEVVGIIGRNGAGKSTLLKILSRITEPDRGRAVVRGRVGSLLEVGTGFHPELTGRENIYLSGAVLGMRRREIARKFDEIVAFAEVEKFLDTPVKHYSSGMYMRLAFAVAAHLEPEILIVDEVLAVGDARFQKKCFDKMSTISRNDGMTVLLVTHQIGTVERICDKAIWLHFGIIKDASTAPQEIIRRYLSDDAYSDLSSVWENSTNQIAHPNFTPIRFCVCDHAGLPISGPISRDSQAFLHIDGSIRVAHPSLTIGYAIYEQQGQLLYWSYHTDTEANTWPHLTPGRHVIRSELPTSILNEGIYRIELIGGIHASEWILAPGSKAPSVCIAISGGLSKSPLWLSKRPGVLAPVIQWSSW